MRLFGDGGEVIKVTDDSDGILDNRFSQKVNYV